MLLGMGIYGGGRSSLKGSSTLGERSTLRPIHSAVSWRMTFNNDFCSFPSGLYSDAIVLPMKLGGLVMRYDDAGGHSATTFSTVGDGFATFTPSSVGSLSVSRVAGTKWATVSLLGTGTASIAYLRGGGFVSMNLSIGSRPSADDIAFAVWGLGNGIEAGWTPRQIMRTMAAVLAGKVSGSGANAPTFRDINDTKDRVSATTDADGNRTALTIDPS